MSTVIAIVLFVLFSGAFFVVHGSSAPKTIKGRITKEENARLFPSESISLDKRMLGEKGNAALGFMLFLALVALGYMWVLMQYASQYSPF